MSEITSAGAVAPTEANLWHRRTGRAALALLVLVILADVLLWRQSEGANVLVFLVALIFAVTALYPERLGRGSSVLLFLVALLSVAPLIETLSPWALLVGQGGITLLALGLAGLLPKFEEWGGVFTRFGLLAPVRLIGDALRLIGESGQRQMGGRFLRLAVVWLVPAVFALVFVLLFSAANPVIEYALKAIRLDRLLELLQPERMILWGFVAIGCWAVLVPKLLRWVPTPQWQGPMQPKPESLLFGSRAILNSLLLFNALFAVQTVLDLIYLWGGVRLPDEMGHAEYAHRGAYPLIVTALLAAAFVLVAMRRDGPGEKSPLIRGLVFLWIGQNVWLVVSSVLRLKLYVEIYYLSEMRIAAFIWMGLVAVGLVLIVVKIVLARSNKWLVMSNLAMLSVTLWGVSWIDMQSMIAFYNVRHAQEVTGKGVPLDQYYMWDLGPAAVPALDELLLTAKYASPEQLGDFSAVREELASRVSAPSSWHGWSWRGERLERYVREHPFAPETGRAID